MSFQVHIYGTAFVVMLILSLKNQINGRHESDVTPITIDHYNSYEKFCVPRHYSFVICLLSIRFLLMLRNCDLLPWLKRGNPLFSFTIHWFFFFFFWLRFKTFDYVLVFKLKCLILSTNLTWLMKQADLNFKLLESFTSSSSKDVCRLGSSSSGVWTCYLYYQTELNHSILGLSWLQPS